MALTLARLRGLSPLGPIFAKELRATARRRRTYVLRFLYLGALLIIMLFFFTIANNEFRRNTRSIVRQAQQLAEMGAIFFAIFSFFTLSAMGLVGPILTATAVNSERLHKTLPVLLMTPITAWQIVAGKLFSRLLIAFTLIGLTLPALSVVRLLGGVETSQIIASLGLSVSVVVAGAALGLLLSTLMNRAYAVILLAYAAMGFLYGLLPMSAGLIIAAASRGTGGMPKGMSFFFSLMGWTNPFFSMAMLVTPAARGAPFKLPPWQYCAAFHLALATVLLLLSGLILRRMARKETEGGSPAPLPTPAGPVPLLNSDLPVQPLFDPTSTPTHPQRTSPNVSDNPVLWREVRRPLMAKRWQALAASLLVAAILVFFYIMMAINTALNDKDAQMAFACVFCGLLTVLACVISATAIAQEKESDTWTLLLSTPLSPSQIVLGKLAGLLRRMMWPSILIVVHFVLFALGGVLNWTTTLVILFLTFTTNIIWVATGLYYSLRLKTVTFAVILNLCGPAILYGLAAIVLGITGALFFDSDNGAEIVGIYAPYAHMVSAIDDLNERYSSRDYHQRSTEDLLRRQVWTPVAGRIPASDFLLTVLGVGLAYLLFTALIVCFTIRSFNRVVGRAGQSARQPTPPLT